MNRETELEILRFDPDRTAQDLAEWTTGADPDAYSLAYVRVYVSGILARLERTSRARSALLAERAELRAKLAACVQAAEGYDGGVQCCGSDSARHADQCVFGQARVLLASTEGAQDGE